MTRVAVVSGPDVPVAPESLERSIDAWCDALGASARTVFAADGGALRDALAADALRDVAGVVLCPGTAGGPDLIDVADRSGVPVAWVDLETAEAPRPPHHAADATSVRGRGIAGYRWATKWTVKRQRESLTAPAGAPAESKG